MSALRRGDPAALGRALTNDLQEAAISLQPDLQGVLDAGLDFGALGGIVSGSGPTVAFLTGSAEPALDLVRGAHRVGCRPRGAPGQGAGPRRAAHPHCRRRLMTVVVTVQEATVVHGVAPVLDALDGHG